MQLEELTTQSVSPTLGTDQLEAGIAAGIIGLALVALYMLVFYRLLGVVVILGLILTAMAVYSLISYLGATIGLTLTLAGVTGLIVSVGVTVDSYVVYFEKLKDEFGLDTLSMGMSDDLDVALAEGATMVRIGTAIFGPRKKEKTAA